jgi:tripartite-type tricarboxylate transporter receptor subunit TctC
MCLGVINRNFLNLITETNMLKTKLALCIVACGLISTPVTAQTDYPNRPVKLVVTFAPGGPADVVARLITVDLGRALGQPVIVENKPGAGGNLGSDVVAKAPKDGYTLLLGSVASHAINSTLYPKLSFDPIKDFEPISLVAFLTPVLTVHPNLPFRSVADLVDYARANPGKLNYASGGVGTTSFLAAEWLKALAKIDIVHVPFRGGGPAMIEQLAGRVDMQFDLLTTALPHIKSGRLRPLAVASPKHSALAPELPTFTEIGYPTLAYTSWFALYAPAGTPKAIVQKLNREVVKIMSTPEMKERLLTNGTEATSSSPEELNRFMQTEITKWAKVVRDSGATAE